MKNQFYKLKRNRYFAGVLAGLSDKYKWDINLVRALYVLFSMFTSGLGFTLYVILAIFLPYKEDLERDRYHAGPRRRKDADVVDDDKDGWIW